MRLPIVLWMCLAPVSMAGQVRVVGPAPAPYPRIQDAINASESGDVVLVKSVSHDSIRVHEAWLTIVADTGLTVQQSGAARVTSVGPRALVVLSGIACQGVADANVSILEHGLVASDCRGQLILQDCSFNGLVETSTVCAAAAAEGGTIRNCARVTFTRCTLVGGFRPKVGTYWSQPNQGRGIQAQQSSLHISASTVTGGSGGLACNGFPDGGWGGNGVEIAQSIALASSSTIRGGNGANSEIGPSGSCLPLGIGGSGGHGVKTTNSSLYLFATSSQGGFRGYGCGLASSGKDGSQVSGPYTAIAGTARRLNGPRVVRDVNLATFTFIGAPGELVEIAASLDRAAHQIDVAQKGVLQVANPRWHRVGVVPATGTLSASYKLPDLPLTNPGATFVVQARFTPQSTGQPQLSNAHVVVEVDATY